MVMSLALQDTEPLGTFLSILDSGVGLAALAISAFGIVVLVVVHLVRTARLYGEFGAIMTGLTEEVQGLRKDRHDYGNTIAVHGGTLDDHEERIAENRGDMARVLDRLDRVSTSEAQIQAITDRLERIERKLDKANGET